MKTSAANRAKNRQCKSGIATIRAKLDDACKDGDKSKRDKLFGEYCSALDKAVKQGILKRNTGDRSKSRAAVMMKNAAQPAKTA